MADEIDRANEQVELTLHDALLQRRPEGPAATGYCLFCGEPLDMGPRWCGTERRDGWQREHRPGRH